MPTSFTSERPYKFPKSSHRTSFYSGGGEAHSTFTSFYSGEEEAHSTSFYSGGGEAHSTFTSFYSGIPRGTASEKERSDFRERGGDGAAGLGVTNLGNY